MVEYSSDKSQVNKAESMADSGKKDIPDTIHISTDYSFKHKILWENVLGYVILHMLGFWGFYVLFTGGISIKTFIWTMLINFLTTEGVTLGAHRYYTHKSFKATPLLRAIIMTLQTVAGQNSMYKWCYDHRLHHRYSDTDADPHNSKRGFFFSHIGWLMVEHHPYVTEFGKKVDMSDLEADWMVMFQKKYYGYLYALLAVFIPMYIPVHYFGEHWWNSLLVCFWARYIFILNVTWLVNSLAHQYGTRPYDQNLQPVESWSISLLTLGEGWHNYHHAFPWDYNGAELSMHFNISSRIIRFLARIGLAYDLKTVSSEMVTNRIKRTGDGSHYEFGTEEGKAAVTTLWGPLHPMNPTFKTTQEAPDVVYKRGELIHENGMS